MDNAASSVVRVAVPSHPHLVASSDCPAFTLGNTLGWDPSLLCADGISARSVVISKVTPATLRKDTTGAQLRIMQIASAT